MAKIMKKAQDGYMAKIKKSAVSDTSRKMGMNFDKKSFDSLPKMKKKANNGFGMLSVKAGVDNNPNPTFADKIAGAKKKAKSGAKMMKLGGAAAKQAAIAIAMKKAGKTPKKKMQYGGEAASMVPTMKKGGKAMYGKSMMSKGGKMKMGGKCKNGC
jgi:hypothetical protein